MPSLRNLLNNLPNFKYYSGIGNFTANDIPYGRDRQGGGDSNEPYIKTPIGNKWSPSIPGLGILGMMTREAADVVRIGKFFTDVPKGPFWLLKQTGLQRMNPIIQHQTDRATNNSGSGFFSNIIANTTNVLNRVQNDLGPTRIYNPLGTNTLAQVGVSGLGIHFTRHGLTPQINPSDFYSKVAINSQRLITLRDRFSKNPGTYDKDTRLIDKYKGGPQSYLGLGDTTILRPTLKTLDDTFGTGVVDTSTYNMFNGFIPMNINSLLNISQDNTVTYRLQPNQNTTGRERSLSSIDLNALRSGNAPIDYNNASFDFSKKDFREFKNLTKPSNLENLTSTNYAKYNIENRIGVMRSRYPSKNNPNPQTMIGTGSRNDPYAKGPTDTINMVSLYKALSAGDTTVTTDINGNPVNKNIIRDLIKFRIKALDNNHSDPNMGVYMVFRAFLTNLSDSMVSNWTPYSYVGRGENFYLYDGFTSQYDISFRIAALSRYEMKPLYQKLNYLKSTMTPDYNTNKMRGNIMEVTVGDYMKYQPGIITSLNITIPENANWEIAMLYGDDEDKQDKDMHDLPQLLDVNFTFIPIYKFLPRKGSDKPFIGIDDSREHTTSPLQSPERKWITSTNI